MARGLGRSAARSMARKAQHAGSVTTCMWFASGYREARTGIGACAPRGLRGTCVAAPALRDSSGETTVTVRGTGRGGRNQEFALAMAGVLDVLEGRVAAASIGTDGIDGPTDAAGAIVDSTTMQRAHAAGLAPEVFLNDNNTYVFFERLGDLVKTGPTATNVGDLQVILVA